MSFELSRLPWLVAVTSIFISARNNALEQDSTKCRGDDSLAITGGPKEAGRKKSKLNPKYFQSICYLLTHSQAALRVRKQAMTHRGQVVCPLSRIINGVAIYIVPVNVRFP